MSFLDLDQFANQGRSKKKIGTIVGVLALCGVVALGYTFASNISLNNGQNVEFGQGIASTTACDNSITLTPTTSFNSAENTFSLTTIEVSDINSDGDHCMNKNFTIKVFDNSSENPLNIYDDVSFVRISDDGSLFSMSSPPGITLIQPFGDNSRFTLQIDPTHFPVPSDQVYRITIQSGEYHPVTYRLGDVGPDGAGIIYLVDTNGFACGPTNNLTCHYLEVAPAGWSGSLTDPYLTFSIPDYFSTAVPEFNGFDASGVNIGTGYANTNAIIAQNGTCSTISSCTYAAGAANAYRGGGYSDWYLPSQSESRRIAVSDILNFSSLHIDTTGTSYWNSWAGNPGAPNAATNTEFTGLGGANNGYEGGYKGKDSYFLVRPIRAF
jgi:hypothetical protein